MVGSPRMIPKPRTGAHEPPSPLPRFRSARRLPRPVPRRASRSRANPPALAAGKRDGRGSETWRDGRSEAFDAAGKDAILIAKSLRKTHDGERYQFREVDLSLSAGQRVAIVGPNGSGKSTLLRVLAGRDVGREDGELWIRKGLRVAFLEQEPPFDESLDVLEALYAADTPLMRLLRDYDDVMAAQATEHDPEAARDTRRGSVPSVSARLAEVLDRMDAMNAWDAESRARTALEKLGCASFLGRKMGQLSGGQRKRVALAAALIEAPDLLVLDEPTNHLSVEGVEWLEETLSGMSGTTTLLVSHDRAFIDATCPDILELDGVGGAHRHRGGYAAYLEGRERRWAAEAHDRAAARNTLRKEAEWMRRQPKARATKEKARVERFYSLSERAATAGSRAKAVELVESKSTRMGDAIVEFDGASLAFDAEEKNGGREGGERRKIIMDGFSYSFSKGEKIALVGPNGAGKTTFLRTIMGEIPLDSGWVAVGETIQFGYYSQTPEFRDEDLKVIDFVREIEAEAQCAVGGFGGRSHLTAYTLLERFNFGGPKQMTPIRALSGGEKRRLQLLSVLALCPNFLILDEPTNDLDLDTIEALEEMLEDFEGCVLVVSHDRQFVDNLVDHIFVFDGEGGINDWNGDYRALRGYLREMDDARTKSERDAREAAREGGAELSAELSEEALEEEKARKQRERETLKEAHNAPSVIDKIERALAVLEEDVAAIDARMLAAGADVSAAQEIQAEKDAKTAKQELYYAEWERLEAVLEEAAEIKSRQEQEANAA